jgi:hypothetical protein
MIISCHALIHPLLQPFIGDQRSCKYNVALGLHNALLQLAMISNPIA